MDCHLPTPTAGLFERKTGVLPPTLVEIIDVPIGQCAPYEARNRVDRQLKPGLALEQLAFRPLTLDNFLSQGGINRGQFRSPLADTPFEVLRGSSPLAYMPCLLECDHCLVHRHVQQKTFRFGRKLWPLRSSNEQAESLLKTEMKYRDRRGTFGERIGDPQTRPRWTVSQMPL